MTKDKAITKARARAKETGDTRYVVFDVTDEGADSQKYHVATLTDLDTYYNGIPDHHVIYCTDD